MSRERKTGSSQHRSNFFTLNKCGCVFSLHTFRAYGIITIIIIIMETGHWTMDNGIKNRIDDMVYGTKTNKKKGKRNNIKPLVVLPLHYHFWLHFGCVNRLVLVHIVILHLNVIIFFFIFVFSSVYCLHNIAFSLDSFYLCEIMQASCRHADKMWPNSSICNTNPEEIDEKCE